MPLDDQLGRWTQRTKHVRDALDPILSTMPEDGRVLPSTLDGLQMMLGEYLRPGDADTPPEDSVLAEVITPFITNLREFQALTTVPGTYTELRTLLSRVHDIAQNTHLALTTDDRLTTQTVDDVIADFAEEYRTSLILALTANYALSHTVNRWQDAKASDPATGDHLDLTNMDNFVQDPNARTIPMSTLTTASTPDPIVITPTNFGASMRALMTGGTPPPIYRMAYTQWFTNIHAAWEDTYRPRLAIAHGTDNTGKPWKKNDIQSEFFNEIRLIRNDISHKRGVCIDSAKNNLIDWIEHGTPIAPTPRQMLNLLDMFPYDELRCTPTPSERTTGQLPYQFPNDWIDTVRAHVETIEPAKRKRAAILQQLIDDWMADAPDPEATR